MGVRRHDKFDVPFARSESSAVPSQAEGIAIDFDGSAGRGDVETILHEKPLARG